MAIPLSIPPIFLFLLTSALLVSTGLKRQPGIGVLGAVILAAGSLWLRQESIVTLGFSLPRSWLWTLVLGLGLGLVLQVFSVALIEPWCEKFTRETHDHSLVDNVRGNWKACLQWVLAVWLLVAILEEGVYRGFLMTEFRQFAGTSPGALLINIVLCSIVFGLSHGYQGRSGMMSTSIIGLFLGVIYVLDSFNLWLVIATHGFIDTIGIGLIASGADRIIQKRIWGAESRRTNAGQDSSRRPDRERVRMSEEASTSGCCFRSCPGDHGRMTLRIDIWPPPDLPVIRTSAHAACLNAVRFKDVSPDLPSDHGRIPTRAKCLFCGSSLPWIGTHPFVLEIVEGESKNRFWAHAECIRDRIRFDSNDSQ